MNNRNKVLTFIGHDKGLLALFTGIVLVFVAMISLVITAGICYL
ncbi:hypothetical protein ACFLXL_00625 [Chloroflexota bacterium]